VIVHFVDIGGIDDHHRLNFLFIIVQVILKFALYFSMFNFPTVDLKEFFFGIIITDLLIG